MHFKKYFYSFWFFTIVLSACATNPFKSDYSKLKTNDLEILTQNYHAHYFYALNELVDRASRAHECLLIRKYSAELLYLAPSLKNDWNYGNAIFDGNMALGYCAAKEKNYNKAIEYLDAACNTPGSPQLDSFGLEIKDLSLLSELIRANKREPVLKCFSNVSRFWNDKYAQKSISQWTQDVSEGKVPKFKFSE